MSKVETLTAYSCSLSFLRRNNPKIEEQSEKIKNNEMPEYTIDEFVNDYVNYAEGMINAESIERSIMVKKENVIRENIDENITRWYFAAGAGKSGKPMKIVKSNGREYDYGSDSTALYPYNFVIYKDITQKDFVMIFHRYNGSGCKSVFLSTANKMLKQKGFKLEMDILISPTDDDPRKEYTEITMKCFESSLSSDIADNMDGPKTKETVIKSIAINLQARSNSFAKDIINDLKLGNITKKAALLKLRNSSVIGEEYTDAEVTIKIGKRRKRVPWSQLENSFGYHDITDQLHSEAKKIGFIPALLQLSDEFYHRLIIGVVVNE